MNKKRLSFYTNIPTPYQLDFFEALALHFDLTVVYYAEKQVDRQWQLPHSSVSYQVIFLKNNQLATIIQRFVLDFHFSNNIFSRSFKDKADFVILGGNYFIPNTLFALLIFKLKGKKIFWFSERLLPNKSRTKYYLKRLLLTPLRIACDGILCIGETAIKSYREYGFRQPMFNVPYNINIDPYRNSKLNHSTHTEDTLASDKVSKKIILTSGSLIHRKGMDIAIDAFQKLHPAYKSRLQLWIIGDGTLKKSLIKSANHDPDIFFLGFKEKQEVPVIYTQADFFLFCSRYDGWGLVINEALAAGLPVIVSSAVGASELIENDVNGIVIDSLNPNDYAKAIENMLDLTADNIVIIQKNNLTKAAQIDSSAMALKVLEISKSLIN